MNTKGNSINRPALDQLACVNARCNQYGQAGQENLSVRKTYGHDQIRYLHCKCCGAEFSERKNTALWNSKVGEDRAVSVAEHLAEGCSLKGTARMSHVNISVVRRLNQCVGEHGQAFHEERVHGVKVNALEGDERYGFAGSKQEPAWEAEVIDPASKLILAHEQGPRDETLIRRVMEESAKRVENRHDLVFFSDGEASYATLFPEIFGVAYQPPRQGVVGRMPDVRYRIPQTLALVQIIKHREGYRVVAVDIRYTYGSQKRANQALDLLGYSTPNTSAIERRNGTARRMNAHQTRKSLAFSRKPETKLALGWWGVTVYNWCPPHSALPLLLAVPIGNRLYQQRSPAMAAGLIHHIFSVRDLLLSPVFPKKDPR